MCREFDVVCLSGHLFPFIPCLVAVNKTWNLRELLCVKSGLIFISVQACEKKTWLNEVWLIHHGHMHVTYATQMIQKYIYTWLKSVSLLAQRSEVSHSYGGYEFQSAHAEFLSIRRWEGFAATCKWPKVSRVTAQFPPTIMLAAFL